MKLILAIVSNDDSAKVAKELTRNRFFLGTDDNKVDQVIGIIGKYSKKRSQMVPSSTSYGAGMHTPFPVEVQVGGATVFVMNVERFEKL